MLDRIGHEYDVFDALRSSTQRLETRRSATPGACQDRLPLWHRCGMHWRRAWGGEGLRSGWGHVRSRSLYSLWTNQHQQRHAYKHKDRPTPYVKRYASCVKAFSQARIVCCGTDWCAFSSGSGRLPLCVPSHHTSPTTPDGRLQTSGTEPVSDDTASNHHGRATAWRNK
jgi:hypothetical protein